MGGVIDPGLKYTPKEIDILFLKGGQNDQILVKTIKIFKYYLIRESIGQI
jgi:hypothetical protein